LRRGDPWALGDYARDVRRLSRVQYIAVMIVMALVLAAAISHGPAWLWQVLGIITIGDLVRKYALRRRRAATAAPTADRSD
jgi:hypothetical protein